MLSLLQIGVVLILQFTQMSAPIATCGSVPHVKAMEHHNNVSLLETCTTNPKLPRPTKTSAGAWSTSSNFLADTPPTADNLFRYVMQFGRCVPCNLKNKPKDLKK